MKMILSLYGHPDQEFEVEWPEGWHLPETEAMYLTTMTPGMMMSARLGVPYTEKADEEAKEPEIRVLLQPLTGLTASTD